MILNIVRGHILYCEKIEHNAAIPEVDTHLSTSMRYDVTVSRALI